jgi:hypothetical protein
MSKNNNYLLLALVISLSMALVACDDDSEPDPPYACTFDNTVIESHRWPASGQPKGCYEYDESVTLAEAKEECKTHKLGAVLKVENKVLEGGGCDLGEAAGYCVVLIQPQPGKEYTEPNKYYFDDPSGDCVTEESPMVEDDNGKEVLSFPAGYTCVNIAFGTFTCTAE